jgi:hypothetical protein
VHQLDLAQVGFKWLEAKIQNGGHRGLPTSGADTACAEGATGIVGGQRAFSARTSICPAGQVLATRYESKLREMTKTDYANRAACLVCSIRARCCTKNFRKVSRLEHDDTLDRMASRVKARPELLDSRRETVEHPSARSGNGWTKARF